MHLLRDSIREREQAIFCWLRGIYPHIDTIDRGPTAPTVESMIKLLPCLMRVI